nr:immunoglobulin light chain junction region [Macaca mulatta]MOV78108.1 immunoglobulin light chain junction region [Macaca mulatta]MOV78174.1 immunoglobulin light chain junction region [Macaca mulatta]MOV78319.1 immunoglobulin light chain junction region [Macaca mulatta]MOV78372.1 immunoglobulin light chain junction region [Macaca mulatta]
SMHDYGWPTTF